eukprot:TRINITY_DN16956_c0_g1_i6.p1 TRINITY_DN16956_c0_g1~~TRINITY_DN16956_c0_g1_i6.p1  ORF type:complete len:562 (-),score=49.83 TRINITY_DN16956_c0_g1_i6:297-1982(-)
MCCTPEQVLKIGAYCLVSAAHLRSVLCRVSFGQRFQRLIRSFIACSPIWQSAQDAPPRRTAFIDGFRKRRVREGRNFMKNAGCLLLLTNTHWILDAITHGDMNLTTLQDVVALIGNVVVWTFGTGWRWHEEWFASISFDTCMLGLTSFMLPGVVTFEMFHKVNFYIRYVRMYASVTSLNLRKAVIWNCVYIGTALLSVFFFSFSGLGYSQTEVEQFVIAEVCCMALMLLFVLELEEAVVTTVAQELDAETRQAAHSAARALLDKLCDMVIELNSDLKIAGTADKLAATLFLNPQISLEGLEFKSLLLLEEEQERLSRVLRGSYKEGGSRAHVCHVTMRDSGGASVRMEMFTVAYQDAFEEWRHLIGIREFTDAAPLAQQSHSFTHAEFQEDGRTPVTVGKGCNDGRSVPQVASHLAECRSSFIREENSLSSLSLRSSSDASSRSATRPSAGPPLVQGCRTTRSTGKSVSLANVIHSWNICISSQFCCPYHAMIEEVRAHLGRFKREPCQQTFFPAFKHQCQDCGILSCSALNGNLCSWCLSQRNVSPHDKSGSVDEGLLSI